MKDYHERVKDCDLQRIIEDITTMTDRVKGLNGQKELNVYSNSEACELLGVTPNLLNRYRNEGLLPFSQVGDKYWYTNDNINSFIKNGKFNN